MATNLCPNCGSLSKGTPFCTNCGSKLSDVVARHEPVEEPRGEIRAQLDDDGMPEYKAPHTVQQVPSRVKKALLLSFVALIMVSAIAFVASRSTGSPGVPGPSNPTTARQPATTTGASRQPEATRPVLQPVAAQPVVASLALNVRQLKNAKYALLEQVIELADGKASLLPRGECRLDDSMVAFGDLDGDSIEDAAVITACNTGGSGTFYTLVGILNLNGTPAQVASQDLGDRVDIQILTVAPGGEVQIDMITHGPNDPMCCPTVQVYPRYRLTPSGFRLTGGSATARSGESTTRGNNTSPPQADSTPAAEATSTRGRAVTHRRLDVISPNETRQVLEIILEGAFGDLYYTTLLEHTNPSWHGWAKIDETQGSPRMVKWARSTSGPSAGLVTRSDIAGAPSYDFKVGETELGREYSLRILLQPLMAETPEDEAMLKAMPEFWTISLPGDLTDSNADSATKNSGTWEYSYDRFASGLEMKIASRELLAFQR